jgi:hypothetical protein
VRSFVFILLIFTSNAFAQLVSRQEVSKEISETKMEELKRHLLFEASQKAVEKFSAELGFKYDDFQKKQKEGFETYFEKYKAGMLEQKFGKDYQANLGKDQSQLFLQEIESHREKEFIRYSKILDLLQSYSFVSMNQTIEEPRVATATIDLTIDRVKMDRLLRRTISGDSKQFARLWIVPELDLNGFTWADLELEKEASFSRPLAEAWKKWWEENLPTNFQDAEVCTEECLVYLENWEMRARNQLSTPHPYYDDGMWLKVSLNLKKLAEGFQWEGRAAILDINTKRLISSMSLPRQQKKWVVEDQKAFNSVLANQLYQTPLEVFSKFQKTLKNSVKLNQSSYLIVQGHKHLGDVLALQELIKTRGSYLGIEVHLESFQQDQAKLLCFYQGEAKVFSDLLSQLKELKSSYSYVLVSELTGPLPVIKLLTE